MGAQELRLFLDTRRYCVLATVSTQNHPVTEGDGDEHRAVAVDGPVTVTRQVSEKFLAVWENAP